MNTHPMRFGLALVTALVFLAVTLNPRPVEGVTAKPIARIPAAEFVPVPTPSVAPIIVDVLDPTAAPTHPRLPRLAEPPVTVVSVSPKMRPRAPRASGSAVAGTATWYCLPGASVCPWMAQSGNNAAAGPRLRAALGGGDHCRPGPHCWRNRYVTVSGRGHTEVVKLIDWCACGSDHVIDLFADVMADFVGADRSGRPLRGGFPATITW